MSKSVFLVDRRPQECCAIIEGLHTAGYQPAVFDDCELAAAAVRRERPDLVLLRRLSTDMFRDEYCRQLRDIVPASATSIIVLASPGARLIRIRCLEEGADDVIDDDIPVEQLLQRIRLMRAPMCGGGDDIVLRYGPLEMCPAQFRVRACGSAIALGRTSFEVLRSLLERPEQIVSRGELIERCSMIATSRSLYEHVGRLRKAMAPLGIAGSIVTVPPEGYMLSLR